MLKLRCSALVVVLIAAMAAGRASAAAPDDREQKLIDILKSDAPPQDKAIPCKQLAVYGTKAAVPALAALLPNKDLSSWARIALEAIPDPAADEALREAMPKVQGRLLIGVINSIAVRRDAKAVDALVARLKDPDEGVASAAAEALGRIGGEQVEAALEPMLAGGPAAVRSSAAYGCILCAERLLNDGKADDATKLYDTVRKANVPKQRLLEATRGAILARGAAGIPMLVEQLKSADKAFYGLGLRVARELPGSEATEAVAAELAKAAPERQAMLLLALGDRNDPKALPAVLAAAKSGPKAVRIVAMSVLERLGNASCTPVLLDAALEDDAEVAQAAETALARLPGQEVDADVLARLAKTTGKTRQVLIELAGQRRVEAALPVLVQCGEDTDAGVRGAAVAAVGTLGGEKQVADLVRILQKTQEPAERAGIEKALMSISARGGAACAKPLMPLAQSADSALRIIAVHALAMAGGPDALAAVKTAMDDKDEAVQDEVARTLSTWPNKWPEDAGVVEPLLALAKSGKKPQHKILGLRGYLQYVHEAKGLSDDARLAKVNDVLPLLTRPEEKRLAIAVLGTIGSGAALESLVAFAADPAIAEEACSAIVHLAGRRDLKGVSKEQRQKALETAAEKSKGGTKKRAEDLLKTIK